MKTDSHLLQRDPVLAEVVRRLVEAYEPERSYLFGSKGRDEAAADSDYDLLLVVPDDAPPEQRRSRLAYEVLWGMGTAADVPPGIWRPAGMIAAWIGRHPAGKA